MGTALRGDADLVLDVEDAFCPWNTGRYRLEADQDAAVCVRTRAPTDLRLTAAGLGAAFLGGTTLASLAGAGLVEELRAGALSRATAAFRADPEPFWRTGSRSTREAGRSLRTDDSGWGSA